MTPAGGNAIWTTVVTVPRGFMCLYVLLSYESGKQRLYANRAINITGE
jgi:hypothetical protein